MTNLRIAVVIPVFRHSLLAAEAVDSALRQDCGAPLIVAVNDGCPHPETHSVLSGLAAQNSEQIQYLHQANGGLSAARNTGVSAALAWGAEAVFFLDADNRLEPWALRRFVDVLTATRADWAYPDIACFGLKGGATYPGPYRVTAHLTRNICEAGSLVHARVFQSGLRFNEAMTKGYEDWAFWLAAAEHGFRGAHVADSGFQYRRRPESMLSGSHQRDTALRQEIRDQRARLYAPQTVKRLCAEERPSLAVADLAAGRVMLCEDPFQPSSLISLDEFCDLMRTAWAAPEEISAPRDVVFTHGSEENIFWRGVLWRMINGLGDGAPRGGRYAPAPVDGPSFSVIPGDGPPDLIAITGRDLAQVLAGDMELTAPKETLLFQIDGAKEGAPMPPAPIEKRWFGRRARVKPAAALKSELYINLQRLIISQRAITPFARPDAWRGLQPDVNTFQDDRFAGTLSGAARAFPMLADGRPSIAFVMWRSGYGGAERVAFEVARAFKIRGWRVGIAVLGAHHISTPKSHYDFADNIVIIGENKSPEWSNDRQWRGDPIPNADADTDAATAALQYYDCVVNAHCWSLYGVLGRLRSAGVITAAHLHLIDQTPAGRPFGHVNLATAFEHVSDYLITCSEDHAQEIASFGVPFSKIIATPNAPGYPAPSDPPPKRDLTGRRPKALYLGRLDRQKGLDRLADLYRQTRDAVDWRFVGGGDIDPVVADFPTEPATYDFNDLENLYRWADFFILMSDYEGLPLSVLEAQRAGAIPICTDVGAVREAVTHGETGFIFPRETAAAEAAALMRRAPQNAAQMQRIADQCSPNAAQCSPRTWLQGTAKLEAILRAEVAKRRAEREIKRPARPAPQTSFPAVHGLDPTTAPSE